MLIRVYFHLYEMNAFKMHPSDFDFLYINNIEYNRYTNHFIQFMLNN